MWVDLPPRIPGRWRATAVSIRPGRNRGILIGNPVIGQRGVECAEILPSTAGDRLELDERFPDLVSDGPIKYRQSVAEL